jgi:hypothetical protein
VNPIFVNPETRTTSNISRLDLIFNKSDRTMIDVFGGYTTLTYGNQVANRGAYNNLQGVTGGLEYRYRVSARGSFSLTYSWDNSHSQFIENSYRSQINSLNLSYAYQISPATTVSFWAGPTYTLLRSSLIVQGPPGGANQSVPVHRTQWNESFGGTVTRSTRITTISLLVSRETSAGGGFVPAESTTSAALTVSRRLVLGWQATTGLAYGRLQLLSFGGLYSGIYDTEAGSASLSHKLGERASIAFDYTHQRQRSGAGNTYRFADLDRNTAGISFNWDIAKVPLGH